MKKEYRFVVTADDSVFQCVEQVRKKHPTWSYRACMNALCADYQELQKNHQEQTAIVDQTVERLREEYDAIWRVRSYATGKNVEILLEVMNSLLLQFDTEAVPTETKKATALSVSETLVNDRLRRFRTHALSQKGKRQ